MALPQNTTTIEEFIEAGRGITIQYPTLSFTEVLQNGTHATILNVINDYMKEIKSASVMVELDKNQQFTYFYKPKLLCYDTYGNPELYFIILLMNDMADVKEFTKSKIRMLKKDHMSAILTNIYNAEKDAIKAYNSKQNGNY